MIRSFLAGLLLGLGLLAMPALAVAPDEILDDPALEARAREISAELRCMVCQNQSIDDSDAPLAKDLRLIVRERLVAGDTNQEVIDYIVGLYTEFVLLKPRFAWHTLVLWAAGPVALLAGAAAIFAALRRRSRLRTGTGSDGGAKLSEDEERRLQALLKDAD